MDLDKVISGELTGEALDKFNADALKDWNDSALTPCSNCARSDSNILGEISVHVV